MNENGVLTTHGGRPALRFERRLAHGRERVWQAVTDPAELSRWYPLRVVGLEPRVGGRISFDDGEGTIYPATVTDFEPPLLFAFDEHDPADPDREQDDHLRIELHEDPAGCLLVFTHVMTDPSTADGVSTGWRACLDALVAALDA